jgi:GTP pyrophosphokinase
MVRLDDVIEELRSNHPDADVDLVRKAYVFSAAAHRGQVRRNGEPYLIHPLEVSYIVSQLRLDTSSVCAGLLHDTVEDTEVTVEEIQETFGEDVASLVEALTKLEKYRFTSAEEAQAENFRKMLVAMSRDLRVILVKLSDRLHNMQTLGFLREAKQRRIAQETLDIYAPLANRLGINWIKTKLEDLCFKYLHPGEYKQLADGIQKTRAEREQYIDRVKTELIKELTEHGVTAEVYGRPKHLWSIRQKMRLTGRDLGNLFDILAFRIIVDKVPQCYEALGVVHARWKPVPGRFKDYVALPKPNGYRSLHTAVIGPENERVEIQIRTREMHRTAELGVAAHWSYKEGQYGLGSQGSEDKFQWLRQLLEWQRDVKDPTEFMQTVKVDLFDNEVYVFTPQGDVRVFPAGATPLDFAYQIHTNLGHECTGAKVNGTIVPLRYQLQNGDIVEILRTSGSKPKPDWVKFVKTGRAATKIRHYLRQEANNRAEQIGIEVLDKELKRYGVSLNKLRRSGGLQKAAQQLRHKTERELLLSLGFGKARPDVVLPHVLPPDRIKAGPKPDKEDTPFQKLMKKVIPRAKGGLIVDGIEGMATHFPKCCSPVHGDPIVGFITRGHGVAIHRKDCANVLDYDPARRVDVRWDDGTRQLRPVQIRVYSSDQPGLLASMSQSFHSAGVNITAVNCRTTSDRRAVNNFTVLVHDRDQLNRVIRMIEGIEGVQGVDRVDA